MKTAKLIPAGFTILCPHCGSGDHADPDAGSFFWTADQISDHHGKAIKCDSCGDTFKISAPKNLRFDATRLTRTA